MVPYRNPKLSIEERTADLLARMTREEKVGQLLQLDARGDLEPLVNERQVGSLLHCNGERLNEAIDLAARTRLGIPILFADDAIHGHSFWPGATIFPTQLGMACSWNAALMRQAARVTAREMSCTGPKWTFSPVLCLTRDLRWGRVNETFGEDPFLIGEFAAAMIEGYQGADWTHPESVLATAKHYAGYSETQGGRDASEADISRRKLRSWFLPPFERAVRAGAMTFMTGYQSMDGVPSTASRWLLREVLKEEWGFQGVLVTDWENVGRLVWEQRVCADFTEAAAVAVRAGNDLMMATWKFREGCLDALEKGLLQESEIDEIVTRLLKLKFRLGLFENPNRYDAARCAAVMACAEHTAINLQVARESVVLLRNEGGLLPLDPRGPARRLAVVGPNADNPLAQNGDWSLGTGQMSAHEDHHPRSATVTVLDGLRAVAPESWQIDYARGCSVLDEQDLAEIPAAVAAAQAADVVVAVVGDDIPLIGEGKSTATLELMGGQKALLEALAATGKPMIVVLVCSKPLVLPPSVQQAAAILTGFNPGMQGGRALAEAIFGELNPSGRLTISFPRHVGQQPTHYAQVRGQHGDRYADLTQEPQFPFGFGLSYTDFVLSDLRVLTPTVTREGMAACEVSVTNTGARAGTTVVQLYIHDTVTSATWVQHELKAFRRETLQAGERRVLRFELPVSELSIVNAEGRRVVEPGEFEFRVGLDSREAAMLKGGFAL